MSGVYKSLKVIVQDTLQRGKTNSIALARVNGSGALSLSDQMEELERIFADKIGRLKAAVKEGEALVADEARHVEQFAENLSVNVAVLAAQLRETEENVRTKESACQKMEESLAAKIHDLQNDLKKKEEVLESRAKELNELKFMIDGRVKRVAELESAVEKAKVEAASHAKSAEHLTKSAQEKIVALEAQLRDAKEIVLQRESTIKGLEQNLAAKIQDFESRMRNKEELLAGRDAEINGLKSQLKLLTKGIEDMSSFFRQAEALAAIERQDAKAAVLGVNGGEEKPATFQSQPAKVTPIAADAPREIVSAHLFQRITGELAEVMGVMGPIATIIVRDHVVALGESMVKFPKTRLPELLESLSKEILDENLKVGFRNRLAENAQFVRPKQRSAVIP